MLDQPMLEVLKKNSQLCYDSKTHCVKLPKSFSCTDDKCVIVSRRLEAFLKKASLKSLEKAFGKSLFISKADLQRMIFLLLAHSPKGYKGWN